MKKYLSLLAVIIVSSALVVGVVSAATTISTNINTGGSLSVTGTSTLATTTFSGNVGIGTTTPNNILSVQGTTTIWSNSVGSLIVGSTIASQTNGVRNEYAKLGFYNSDTDFPGVNSQISSRTSDGYGIGGDLVFSTTPGLWDTNQGGGMGSENTGNEGILTQRMIIAPNGKVGIGETVPGGKLSVLGGMAVGSTTAYSQAAVTSGNLIVQGNMGIGTTTPAAQFDVTNTTASATTTIALGNNAAATKGTCIKLLRADGTPIYASVAAGATTFTLSTTACATVTGF